MQEKTYNGWTNYETWNVALWLGNEEGSYRYWQEITQECYDQAEANETWTREEAARFALADRLKNEIEEAKDTILEEAKQTCSMWADLLGAAVSEVNWDEIASNWMEDIDKEEETTDDEERANGPKR